MLKGILLMFALLGFANAPYALETNVQSEMLAMHNLWRQKVDSAPLKWSSSLTNSAQAYAEKLKTNNLCKPKHSGLSGVGENLFWASAVTYTMTSASGVKTKTSKVQDVTSKKVTDAWGNEQKDYSYQNNTCATGKVCGHYTQVVWKDTTELGCGYAVCPDNTQVWVCQYTPAGNIVGRKPY